MLIFVSSTLAKSAVLSDATGVARFQHKIGKKVRFVSSLLNYRKKHNFIQSSFAMVDHCGFARLCCRTIFL
jgi:DNA-directed RNA polymerase subunit N (RpoN/RPB10)